MVVYEKSLENKEYEGMGTTLEVCLIYNSRAYIAHIGDSRIFRIRKGLIRQLTQDHSYVQTLVKEGTITKEEAKHHPKKNMLTKALGCNAGEIASKLAVSCSRSYIENNLKDTPKDKENLIQLIRK